MASNRMQVIFDSKVRQFVGYFSYDANSLFYDKSGKMIHPGEFGKYREEACKQLLKTVLDKNIGVADGFVITSDDVITTQCDIIGYNSMVSPVISDGIAKMFPSEEVYAIGEIKSNMTKAQYIEALRKMARNKEIILKGRTGTPIQKTYDSNTYNTIVTFLICKKLNFNVNEVTYEEIYKGIDREYWHNLVLSVEDGLFTYKLDFKNATQDIQEKLNEIGYNMETNIEWNYSYIDIYGIKVETIKNYVCTDAENRLEHIKQFWVCLAIAIKEVWKYEYDPIIYLGYNVDALWK